MEPLKAGTKKRVRFSGQENGHPNLQNPPYTQARISGQHFLAESEDGTRFSFSPLVNETSRHSNLERVRRPLGDITNHSLNSTPVQKVQDQCSSMSNSQCSGKKLLPGKTRLSRIGKDLSSTVRQLDCEFNQMADCSAGKNSETSECLIVNQDIGINNLDLGLRNLTPRKHFLRSRGTQVSMLNGRRKIPLSRFGRDCSISGRCLDSVFANVADQPSDGMCGTSTDECMNEHVDSGKDKTPGNHCLTRKGSRVSIPGCQLDVEFATVSEENTDRMDIDVNAISLSNEKKTAEWTIGSNGNSESPSSSFFSKGIGISSCLTANLSGVRMYSIGSGCNELLGTPIFQNGTRLTPTKRTVDHVHHGDSSSNSHSSRSLRPGRYSLNEKGKYVFQQNETSVNENEQTRDDSATRTPVSMTGASTSSATVSSSNSLPDEQVFRNPFIDTPQNNDQQPNEDINYPSYDDIGDPDYTCEHCGAIFWYDEKTSTNQAKSATPRFSMCCMNGKIRLSKMKPPPPAYSDVLYGSSRMSRQFQKGLRMYNHMFSFTSMGGRVDKTYNTGRSAPNFRLNGENYHRMGTLLPTLDPRAMFAQLYIYDTENEVDNRCRFVRLDEENEGVRDRDVRKLHREIVEFLKKLLDDHNDLVKWFRYARDALDLDSSIDLKLRLINRRSSDGRVTNTPQASEVAALIVGDISNLENNRDIVVQSRGGYLQHVSELHVLYLPLQYPLIYFFGEDGFRDDIKHVPPPGKDEEDMKNVSMRQYIAYRIMERLAESPHIMFCRRLFQQFLVDSYTMVEAYRLRYYRDHQKDFRSDSYSALHDAFSRGEGDTNNIGKRVIMPSSFTGGARYMIQNYHDAMAICRHIGYPSLFITMTCNPKWPEIRRFTKRRGLTADDRQDIVARIFRKKLKKMLVYIRKKKKLFGEIISVIYTIEFQNRGLPHAHILLFVKGFPNAIEAETVDKFISAEIPDMNEDPEYYSAVSEFMIHGPCGPAFPNSPCMSDGKCKKHFPKRFVERTTVDNDGFVKYMRRENDNRVSRSGIELDNRFVVPHNKELLKRYRCHVNVEWCNQSRAIKYLFKYVHKGQDRTTAVFYETSDKGHGEVVDEIKQYLDCRYVSASEAAWRLLKFEIHYNDPNVVRIGFHLPDAQNILFRPGTDIRKVLKRKSAKESMLTAWFALNVLNAEARELTYAELPSKFVWHNTPRKWQRRQRGFAIGRLAYVYPGSGELYYLRILLNVVRGATCFEDIRTFNGTVYTTFREACYARGLLDDDREFIDGLKEASEWGCGQKLRSLFVTMLTSDSMSMPNHVWEQTWKELSADIQDRYRMTVRDTNLTLTEEQLKNYCLIKIEKIMKSRGRSLNEYPSIPYPTDIDVSFFSSSLINDELNYDRNELHDQHIKNVAMMNSEQKNAYETIVGAVNGVGLSRVFFLYGYGGTGKTFIWNTLSAALRSQGRIVLNVASSGIASLLLPGGRTAHSRFGIPINLTEESMCEIKAGTEKAKLIQQTDLIIWDEAPMMHRNCFEALDRTLRDIMKQVNPENENKPFGGKVVVFGGDFRQILPVIPKGTRSDIVHATINASMIWSDCQVLRLTKNMRLQGMADSEDANALREFSEWLTKVGDGELGDQNDGEANVVIPEDMLVKDGEDVVRSIVDATYPGFDDHIGDIDFLKGRAILAPTLDEVHSINEYMVGMHKDADEVVYLSCDSLTPTDRGISNFANMHTVEFLNTIKASGLPNHELRFKVGVPVMLLRNIDPASGLCNGTRMVIKKLGSYVIEAKILGGKNSGETVYIPRMTLSPSDSRMPFKFQRRQFPLLISYAMTINKSQGQSLSTVGVFLRKKVFTHGQLYVAVSRVTNRKGLKMLLCDGDGRVTNKTANVVYKEVFENV